MKNRDTILLEEAYNKTRLLKEQGDEPMSVDSFEKEERLKGHVQRAEQRAEDEIAPDMGSSGLDPETEKMYWSAFEKLKTGEISTQQWGDICAKILSDLMNLKG